MKIRTDFVTNSSSSSFVLIRIESATVKQIVDEFKDTLFSDDPSNYDCMYRVFNNEWSDSKNEIEISGDEVWCDVPANKSDVVPMLATLFGDRYMLPDREDYETEEDYQEAVKETLAEAEEDGMSDAIKFAKRIMESEAQINEDLQKVEWRFSDIGWGGDDDTRFYQDSYDEKTLAEMYEIIAEKNGCAVEDVTDDDFGDYVCSGQSNSETTFTYDRETGEEKVTHDYQVEIF